MKLHAFIYILIGFWIPSIAWTQNCKAVTDCSTGRCLAAVHCEDGKTTAKANSADTPSINQSTTSIFANEQSSSSATKGDINSADMAKLLLSWYRLLPYSDNLAVEVPPDVGYFGQLNESQARWCIFESVRLNSIRGKVTATGVNFLLDQHKELCGQAKIIGSLEKKIVAELATSRAILNLQGTLIRDLVSGKISDFLIPYRYFEGTPLVDHDRYYSQIRSNGTNASCKKMQEAGNPDGYFCPFLVK